MTKLQEKIAEAQGVMQMALNDIHAARKQAELNNPLAALLLAECHFNAIALNAKLLSILDAVNNGGAK